MNIFSLKKRGSTQAGVEPVADLDALIQSPVPFRCLGRIHYLKPVSTAVFFQVTNALAAMSSLREASGEIEAKTLMRAYHELFSAVCDTITMDDLKEMSQAQCVALLQLIIDTVTGKTHADIEKKKRESQTEIVRMREPIQPEK